VRTVDALCRKAFDDGTGKVNPAGDIDAMDTELVIADLQVAEAQGQPHAPHAAAMLTERRRGAGKSSHLGEGSCWCSTDLIDAERLF
jgi:hypothetical protein